MDDVSVAGADRHRGAKEHLSRVIGHSASKQEGTETMGEGIIRGYASHDMGDGGARPRGKRSFLIKMVLLACVLGVAATTAHAAEDTPEWDRLKICFDKNLAVLIRSSEPIDSVLKAVHTICQSEIDEALQKASAEIKIGSEPFLKTPSDVRAFMAFITSQVDKTLFAYAVKFKAVGGPTTLQY